MRGGSRRGFTLIDMRAVMAIIASRISSNIRRMRLRIHVYIQGCDNTLAFPYVATPTLLHAPVTTPSNTLRRRVVGGAAVSSLPSTDVKGDLS